MIRALRRWDEKSLSYQNLVLCEKHANQLIQTSDWTFSDVGTEQVTHSNPCAVCLFQVDQLRLSLAHALAAIWEDSVEIGEGFSESCYETLLHGAPVLGMKVEVGRRIMDDDPDESLMNGDRDEWITVQPTPLVFLASLKGE